MIQTQMNILISVSLTLYNKAAHYYLLHNRLYFDGIEYEIQFTDFTKIFIKTLNNYLPTQSPVCDDDEE